MSKLISSPQHVRWLNAQIDNSYSNKRKGWSKLKSIRPLQIIFLLQNFSIYPTGFITTLVPISKTKIWESSLCEVDIYKSQLKSIKFKTFLSIPINNRFRTVWFGYVLKYTKSFISFYFIFSGNFLFILFF